MYQEDGCEIDTDCSTYVSHPAILISNNSRNTIILRNAIVDSWRAITLGLGNSHEGGRAVTTSSIRAGPGDTGIELCDVHDVVGNTTPCAPSTMGRHRVRRLNWGDDSEQPAFSASLERPSRGASTAAIDGNNTDGTWNDLAELGSPQLAEGRRTTAPLAVDTTPLPASREAN